MQYSLPITDINRKFVYLSLFHFHRKSEKMIKALPSFFYWCPQLAAQWEKAVCLDGLILWSHFYFFTKGNSKPLCRQSIHFFPHCLNAGHCLKNLIYPGSTFSYFLLSKVSQTKLSSYYQRWYSNYSVMSVNSAAIFKSLCRLGFKVDSTISRDILQAIEHTILWEEMNALVSERFRVSFN